MTEWRTVIGFPEYEVSSDGRVRRVIDEWRPRRQLPFEISQKRSHNGYFTVHLSVPTLGPKTKRVHVLMLEAFIGLRPEGCVARHLDGSLDNNVIENLAWGTQQDNIDDRGRHGKHPQGERNGKAKLTQADVEEIRRQFPSQYGTQSRLARQYGVRPAIISKILKNQLWRHTA